MISAILLSFIIAVPNETLSYNDYKSFLITYEGISFKPYKDGNQICVGVGHSLTAHHNLIKSIYSEYEIDHFFQNDLSDCLSCLHKNIPDFDSLPLDVRLVCVQLEWTVGATGFSKFHNFIWAANNKMYNLMAIELADTLWFHQVSEQRAMNCYNTLKNIK